MQQSAVAFTILRFDRCFVETLVVVPSWAPHSHRSSVCCASSTVHHTLCNTHCQRSEGFAVIFPLAAPPTLSLSLDSIFSISHPSVRLISLAIALLQSSTHSSYLYDTHHVSHTYAVSCLRLLQCRIRQPPSTAINGQQSNHQRRQQ